jgi:hypothetical protein
LLFWRARRVVHDFEGAHLKRIRKRIAPRYPRHERIQQRMRDGRRLAVRPGPVGLERGAVRLYGGFERAGVAGLREGYLDRHVDLLGGVD